MGSDVALVQRLLLDTVRAEAEVMSEPPPTVYFVGPGIGSLIFEARFFVGKFDRRHQVQHALNLAFERVLRDLRYEVKSEALPSSE